jgi:hypothetical protein
MKSTLISLAVIAILVTSGPVFGAPKKAQPWWVSGADLGALEFYSPHSLTGRVNGWGGIAPDGRIFIYSFTM